MNKKFRKYIFIIAGAFIVFGVIASFIFASQVNIYGKIKIIPETDEIQNYVLVAKGVFGSENKVESVQGEVYLEGYYRNIEIRDIEASEVKSIKFDFYEKGKSFNCINFDLINNNDLKTIVIREHINNGDNIFKRLIYIITFELSNPVFKDVLFFLAAIIFILIVFIVFRNLKKKQKKEGVSIYKSILTNISVFALGLVFWLIVILLVLEIGLRIAGLIYSEKQPKFNVNNDDNKLVVLCIGDSFTYGIGSTKGNDYPAQLQRVLQENTNKEVIVINRGRCAQNTAQTIEKLQEDLNSCNPDIVIMLFGMANSWNYYGFDNANTYFERIRIVKLFKRIRYNIKYKGESSDTRQKVEDFAFNFLSESLKYSKFGDDAYKRYYYVGRYCLALRDWENAFIFLSFALSLNQNDIDSYNALYKCVEEFDSESFYSDMSGNIETTIVPQTIIKLDSFISKYPDVDVFKYLKAIYLKEKSGIEISKDILSSYVNSLIEVKGFDYKIAPLINELFNNDIDSIENFYRSLQNINNQTDIYIAIVWLSLSRNNIPEAKKLFSSISPPESEFSKMLYVVADAIIKITDEEEVISNEYVNSFMINSIKEMSVNIDNSKLENEFGLGINKLFELLIESQNGVKQYYFLPHHLKRTADIKQSEIFCWIESDIEKAVEICIKQNYKVICMNYPIVPPPNSEEISFWADSVGKIWKKTSLKYNLLFIDNDSIFKSKGSLQKEYFEPYEKGSEHCNDKGYKLIAENIYYLLKKKKVMD
ncbi:MAG TPA: SGNH/GDSL hydrolase family protein [Bacteroidales bacterium]|nr:SGNH/GDSL hydrolase family protein [Bacteroidales bacterium]